MSQFEQNKNWWTNNVTHYKWIWVKQESIDKQYHLLEFNPGQCIVWPGLRSITKAILSTSIWVDSSEARINGQTITPIRTGSGLCVVQHGSRPCRFKERATRKQREHLPYWQVRKVLQYTKNKQLTRQPNVQMSTDSFHSLPNMTSGGYKLKGVILSVVWSDTNWAEHNKSCG